MAKRIIAQRRGRSPRFTAPSHNWLGQAKHPESKENIFGTVTELNHCPGHSAPLAKMKYSNNTEGYIIAPEGLRVGELISSGPGAGADTGNISLLGNLPEGTLIYNIETMPGDGGKLVRSSGTFARILMKTDAGIMVELPSKKSRTFSPECRASVGVVAGGGRMEKPLLKAGKNYFAMKKAKKKMWPVVAKVAMQAVAHPYGSGRSSRKGRPNIAPKNAPPGRKVGKIRPRRTGKKR